MVDVITCIETHIALQKLTTMKVPVTSHCFLVKFGSIPMMMATRSDKLALFSTSHSFVFVLIECLSIFIFGKQRRYCTECRGLLFYFTCFSNHALQLMEEYIGEHCWRGDQPISSLIDQWSEVYHHLIYVPSS